MFIFLIALCLMPLDALAWGPACHLEYASHALASLALFPPLVKKLLAEYPEHFLYGSLAPDIILGKNARGDYHNNHNWRVALGLYFKKAKIKKHKAFMLGYLGHLAVDTVSHNFFVPYKLIRSWNSRIRNHLYWEMLMDISVEGKYWDMIDRFAGHDFEEEDKFLERNLKRTLFSFKTSKKIFKHLLFLVREKRYKRFASRVSNRTKWDVKPHDVALYKGLCKDAIVDMMANLRDSKCLHADPTGKLKMLYAKDILRKIRKHHRAEKLSEAHEERLKADIKKSLCEGLYQVAPLPSIDDYLSNNQADG